jgi:hypothetical protein
LPPARDGLRRVPADDPGVEGVPRHEGTARQYVDLKVPKVCRRGQRNRTAG